MLFSWRHERAHCLCKLFPTKKRSSKCLCLGQNLVKMDFRRADLRYAQDARGRDRSVQPSPQPGPHCSVPRVLFPFKDLYSLCTLLNIPLYRFRFCCISETKTLFGCAGKGSMNNENGVSNWTYPNGQYYSLQKLPQAQKSVFEGQTPLVFCSDFSDFGSEFVWVSCERCINKGISVKISFFVQYFHAFIKYRWDAAPGVQKSIITRSTLNILEHNILLYDKYLY